MVLEPLLSQLSTGLVVGAIAGLLSLLVWAIALLFARYRLSTYGSRVTLLQLLVVAGGILLVDRLISRELAAGVGVVVAALWCGAVIYETYLRATRPMPAVAVQSPTAPAGGDVTTKQPRPYPAWPAGQRAVGAEGGGVGSPLVGQPSVSPFTSLTEWVDLQKIPTRPLAKRPTLGKRTVQAFHVKNS